MNIFALKKKKYVLFNPFSELSYLDIEKALKGLKELIIY